MKFAKTKFCVTIVQTFSPEYLDEAMAVFVKNLKELGADDSDINNLVTKNLAIWYDEDLTQRSTICVEIIKDKAML